MKKLTPQAIAALRKLPADGSWLELTEPRNGVRRPKGVGLLMWDKLVCSMALKGVRLINVKSEDGKQYAALTEQGQAVIRENV